MKPSSVPWRTGADAATPPGGAYSASRMAFLRCSNSCSLSSPSSCRARSSRSLSRAFCIISGETLPSRLQGYAAGGAKFIFWVIAALRMAVLAASRFRRRAHLRQLAPLALGLALPIPICALLGHTLLRHAHGVQRRDTVFGRRQRRQRVYLFGAHAGLQLCLEHLRQRARIRPGRHRHLARIAQGADLFDAVDVDARQLGGMRLPCQQGFVFALPARVIARSEER